MADHGEPRSFLDVAPGIDVFSADGRRVGALEQVLADDATAIFDGLIIDTAAGPGGRRFVDAPDVDELRERAVVLKLTADEVARLPKPSANPAVMRHGGAEDAERRLGGGLRTLWARLTGRV